VWGRECEKEGNAVRRMEKLWALFVRRRTRENTNGEGTNWGRWGQTDRQHTVAAAAATTTNSS
jgi:hypothetical protein